MNDYDYKLNSDATDWVKVTGLKPTALEVGNKAQRYYHTIEIKFFDFKTEIDDNLRLVYEDRFSFITEGNPTVLDDKHMTDYIFNNHTEIMVAINLYNQKFLSESTKITFSDLQRQWERVGKAILIKD